MGPTNIALVKLFQADQQLREAQGRLESASRSVRVQERKINDLAEKLKLSQQKLKEQQAKAGELDLDIKSRDAHIEKLRTQQQEAHNHKEYQAFLTEINTEKIDKNKVEDEMILAMEAVEKGQGEVKELSAQLDAERKAHAAMQQQLGGKLAALQGDVDKLKPIRDEAAKAVSRRGIDMFERLAEKLEGEALAAVGKPDRRREEYICMACHMSLVADVYNRLHTRDDIVVCPNCHRLLYIPDDLPPETAIHKPKERREPPREKVAASIGRQVSAADVSRSIMPEADEPAAEEPAAAPSVPSTPSTPDAGQ